MKTINRKYKYYEIFNISKLATTTDIKKAYRILVKKYHPDVNSDPQAGEIVKKINKIYSILSNEKTRQEYDSAEAECPKCYSHRIFSGRMSKAVNATWTCRDCGRNFIYEKLKEEVKRDRYDVEFCLRCGGGLRFDGFLRLFVCKNDECGARFAYSELHKTATSTSKPVGKHTKNSFLRSNKSYKVLKLVTGVAFGACILITGYLIYIAVITSSALAFGVSFICIGFTLLSWYIFSYPHIVISKIKAVGNAPS